MLTARRVYPDAPNHRVGTVVHHCGMYTDGRFRRAVADAELTGHLWSAMCDEI